MFCQNLYTDADEYQSAEEFHPQVKSFTAEYPDKASDDGNHERGDTDGGKRESQRIQAPVTGKGE